MIGAPRTDPAVIATFSGVILDILHPCQGNWRATLRKASLAGLATEWPTAIQFNGNKLSHFVRTDSELQNAPCLSISVWPAGLMLGRGRLFGAGTKPLQRIQAVFKTRMAVE
jgi:hypothetical protein